MKIIVFIGEITQQQAGAIVNSVYSQLIMDCGAVGAIKRVAGREIDNEAQSNSLVLVEKQS
jgi:O-acetyl-ADP-ribose deacetylase (regulator of RNase III)